jgi:hypothetical protein
MTNNKKQIEDFEKWVQKCPVKIVGRSDVISGKNAEDGLVDISFYKTHKNNNNKRYFKIEGAE